MSRNSQFIFGVCIAVLLFCLAQPRIAVAQSEEVTTDSVQTRGKYALVAYVGGGLTRFVGDAGTPSGFKAAVSKNGGAGTFRLMWHPDHRLKFGLETGWTSFYFYKVPGGSSDATVKLTGTPLLLVFSMPIIKHVHVFAGSGGYFLNSELNYAGRVSSSTFSIGFMASAMYEVPLSDKVSLAAEFKWFNARETRDSSLSLQLMAIWKLVQY